MKKIMFTLAALFTVAFFTSCKKDYICTCSYSTANGNYGSTTTTLSTTDIGGSKSSATTQCSGKVSEYITAYPTTTCTIN